MFKLFKRLRKKRAQNIARHQKIEKLFQAGCVIRSAVTGRTYRVAEVSVGFVILTGLNNRCSHIIDLWTGAGTLRLEVADNWEAAV